MGGFMKVRHAGKVLGVVCSITTFWGVLSCKPRAVLSDFTPTETLGLNATKQDVSPQQLLAAAFRDALALLKNRGIKPPSAVLPDPCHLLVPTPSARAHLKTKGFLDRNGLLQGPLYFAGVQAMVQGIATRTTGVDYVWDSAHQQFAVFTYRGNGFSIAAGASTSGYLGLALTKQKNVIEAWSGSILEGSVDVGIPGVEKFFSGVAGGFVSSQKPPQPNFTTMGISAGAQVGATISADGALLPVSNPVIGTALYQPANNLTKKFFERYLTATLGGLAGVKKQGANHIKTPWYEASLVNNATGGTYVQFSAPNPLLTSMALLSFISYTVPAYATQIMGSLIGEGVRQTFEKQGQHIACKIK